MLESNVHAERLSKTSFEQLAYELQEIWEEDWFPHEDYERVQALAKLIPDASDTVLDVGCGSGLFLNHLKTKFPARFRKLLGVDRSEAALAHVQTDKRLANIDYIPIDDLQFDTVTCMEVLEHLPLAVYTKARGEIARIAKKTILVCVPYKEDIKASHCECPACFTCFHPDYHVRCFDEGILKGLFSGWSFAIEETHYLGPQVVRYDYELRTRIRNMFVKDPPTLPSYAVCPVCGFLDKERLADDLANRKRAKGVRRVAPGEKKQASDIRRFLRSALTMPQRYRWIAATYKRIDLSK